MPTTFGASLSSRGGKHRAGTARTNTQCSEADEREREKAGAQAAQKGGLSSCSLRTSPPCVWTRTCEMPSHVRMAVAREKGERPDASQPFVPLCRSWLWIVVQVLIVRHLTSPDAEPCSSYCEIIVTLRGLHSMVGGCNPQIAAGVLYLSNSKRYARKRAIILQLKHNMPSRRHVRAAGLERRAVRQRAERRELRAPPGTLEPGQRPTPYCTSAPPSAPLCMPQALERPHAQDIFELVGLVHRRTRKSDESGQGSPRLGPTGGTRTASASDVAGEEWSAQSGDEPSEL